MSGICGIVRLDGKPVAETELDPFLTVLERRGPDGSNAWAMDIAALGHTSLATTPEAATETQPVTHTETGCTITADARLDEREALIEALGIEPQGRAIGDAELILLAYLKWGTSCAEHLRGDFAFAIWDPREQHLFAARDLIGMRQLIWHHAPRKLFAFATEPEALLQHPEIERRINEERIADFLEDLEAYDLTSTFYVGAKKLPPAHAMVVRQSEIRTWRYGSLTPQVPLSLSSDEEYAEAFLDVFSRAVSDRLRSRQPVGSMLSGGMDSGSVSAMAAGLLRKAGAGPLQTFSASGTNADCRETRAIRAAMQIDHIDSTDVSLADLKQYCAELETLIRNCAEPFDGHMTLLMAVYLAAQREGRNVMLDGVGGDTTLGTQNMLQWHMRRGQVIQAWREAKGEKRFWDYAESAAWKFGQSVGQVLIPEPVRKFRHEYLRRRSRRDLSKNSLAAPAFAQRVDLPARIKTNAAHVAIPAGDSFEDRQNRILHPYVTVARERYDRVASALAIEPRDPFLDRRVMEFCLSLPADQLQRGGWPKFILRNAMSQRLPDSIRWRSGKEHLGWDFTKKAWSRFENPELFEPHPSLSRFTADIAKEDVNSSGLDESAFADALTVRYLSNWLSTRGRVDEE